jgi:hypothetical protein
MNIFEQLKDIISDKNNLLIKDYEKEKDFVPYMVQRWLSFYSSEYAELLNCSTNLYWKGIVNDKQLFYKLYLGVIPKSKYKNIKYIKKTKENTKKLMCDDNIVRFLAERFELSEKEIREYLGTGLIDIKYIKKQLNT